MKVAEREASIPYRTRRDAQPRFQGAADPPSRTWGSFAAVEFAAAAWIVWFNNHRLLKPIDNIPPAEAEGRPLRYA